MGTGLIARLGMGSIFVADSSWGLDLGDRQLGPPACVSASGGWPLYPEPRSMWPGGLGVPWSWGGGAGVPGMENSTMGRRGTFGESRPGGSSPGFRFCHILWNSIPMY